MNMLKDLVKKFQDFWAAQDKGVRRSLVLGVFLSVVLAGIVGYWVTQKEYVELFSELTTEESGAITAKLQSLNIPYKLDRGGMSILVPSEQVQQVRVDLAREGLPSAGKGYELFDGNSMVMAPMQHHLNFVRALQTELGKSIKQVDGVVDARVHLVLPEPTPFIREKKPATASVVIKTRPGLALSRSNAHTIALMVSKSVEGLTPENVTLMDTTGHLLFESRSLNGAGALQARLDQQREVEQYLSSKAEEMLTQVLGPGRAIVRVSAELNTKSLTETRELYDTENKSVKKEVTENHKVTNASGSSKAPAGTASNVKVADSKSSSSGGGQNETDEKSEIEYHPPAKTVQQRTELGGNIERLSVAAMVDLEKVENLNLEAVQDIVKRAVGFKQGRDDIKVSEAKLNESVPTATIAASVLKKVDMQFYLNVAKQAVFALVVFGLLGMAFILLKKAKPIPPPAPVLQPGLATNAETGTGSGLPQDLDTNALVEVLAAWLNSNQEAPAEKQRLAA